MRTLLILTMAVVLTIGVFAVATPQKAAADDGYWNSYWGWYDGRYAPTYYRANGYYYGYPYYAYPYGYTASYPYYYGAAMTPYYGTTVTPYSTYYGPSYYGYGWYGPQYGVQVGRFGFSWR